MSEFKKRSILARPVVPQEKDKKPPKTFEVRAAAMPGKTLTSKLIKPVGAAMLLLASLAFGDTFTVGAPQGNQGACPFPGCRGTASVADVTADPYNAPNTGAADATFAIQMAVDSGAATVYFPAGTYTVCNLRPQAQNQRWIGAGIGQTFLKGTAGCTNPIAMSANGVFSGPTFEWEVTGFTFAFSALNDLSIQCRDQARVSIHDNAFDVCSQTNATAQGINLTGCRDFHIDRNEFYSTCPGNGKGLLAAGIRGGSITHNTCNWAQTCFEVGSTVNQPTEFTDVSGNIGHLTFWGLPTKFTNSGATVSYAGTVLTDTAAAFTGLCGDTGTPPASCGAAVGNLVRALTPRTTGTAATFNVAGGELTDASKNFTGLGVSRGDLIRTTPLCFGNGTKPQTSRNVCTGSAGTGAWGDSCVCTANADCASALCEPRFATVDQIGLATTLQVDEWTRDSPCALGSAPCAMATRRPSGAPLTTTGIAYTLYGWAACQITSYTATTATCTANGWFNWLGTTTTPANATLYEIEYQRTNYFLLAGNNGSSGSVQGMRITNNAAVGGYSDHFELFGTQSIVLGNHSRDCQDTCFVISGDKNTVSNNIADHCGARGIILNNANDSTLNANIAFDSPWINVSTTTLGDVNVFGSRNTIANNKVIANLPTAMARYGYVSFSTADQNQFVNNTCQGAYSVGCYRFDGASSTNNHLVGYHGETISNNGGTYSIEGGLTTEALLVANAAQAGSFCGCSDCTIASPTAAGGTGAMAIRSSTGPQWNGR